MELNLSSGRVNRSGGAITRVPEKVDPGRAVARTRIVSPVELGGACRGGRQCAPWVRSVRPLHPCRCLAYWTSASIAQSQQPTPCARSRQRWPGADRRGARSAEKATAGGACRPQRLAASGRARRTVARSGKGHGGDRTLWPLLLRTRAAISREHWSCRIAPSALLRSGPPRNRTGTFQRIRLEQAVGIRWQGAVRSARKVGASRPRVRSPRH